MTETTEKKIETSETAEKRVRKPRLRKEGDKTEIKHRVSPKRLSTQEVVDEFKTWLNGLDLGVSPAVHINGAEFTDCVLSVDFGTPLKGIRLTTEQNAEMVNRLRNVTKHVMNKEVKVGVLNDHSNGIWWTTIN
jgi:hypothetical protein